MLHSIILPIAIGFTLFLSGMKLMELALHRLAGTQLNRILQRFTATPIHGLAAGAISTAFLQSSTAVTVISIGLVNAGLLTFPRTLGIILGTNIGTCLTTELLGLSLERLTMPLLILSVSAWLLTALLGELQLIPALRTGGWLNTLRSASVATLGFGILLAGMAMMQSVGPDIQQSALFDWFMSKTADSLWWGLAAGAVLTAAVHSSTAVIAIIMGFAAIGAMPLEVGIAVVLGANIGTCVTALLASIGGSRAGQFVALAHVTLNVGGALLFMPFIGLLAGLSAWLTAAPAAQIAHAQTLFNIFSSLLALPLCYLPALRRMSRQD
ncbi:sodium:phosphate symporter [Paenibacillus sp. BIHB 4019]|uniref:Sodium:phosphate symporter n=1 Tax=Paenibacillus sp. BIHB 4019 TaxID=1870819 RepID=A0A1B2DLK3_9BACL|nr:Na/Pi symporter [Paenibacillus sp. BIHB 4019]ANY68586.1 sodium:phosphate symporter [Paenibacillus sp. BIHB 4019]